MLSKLLYVYEGHSEVDEINSSFQNNWFQGESKDVFLIQEKKILNEQLKVPLEGATSKDLHIVYRDKIYFPSSSFKAFI